jgi:hypothetical protein
MVVYTGNVIKMPQGDTQQNALPYKSTSTSIATHKRTLEDECRDFLYNDVPLRPRIGSTPEPEPFVVNRPGSTATKAAAEPVHKPVHKTKPKTPPAEEALDDSFIDRFHYVLWENDDVKVSNMRLGASGGMKSITVTFSTADNYKFSRLLEEFEKAMPKKAPAARKTATRKSTTRR